MVTCTGSREVCLPPRATSTFDISRSTTSCVRSRSAPGPTTGERTGRLTVRNTTENCAFHIAEQQALPLLPFFPSLFLFIPFIFHPSCPFRFPPLPIAFLRPFSFLFFLISLLSFPFPYFVFPFHGLLSHFYLLSLPFLYSVFVPYVWPGGVMVMALDLRHRRSRVRLPALRFQVTTLGKLFTRVCLCHQAV